MHSGNPPSAFLCSYYKLQTHSKTELRENGINNVNGIHLRCLKMYPVLIKPRYSLSPQRKLPPLFHYPHSALNCQMARNFQPGLGGTLNLF